MSKLNSINFNNIIGNTPLHIAAYEGQEGTVAELIESGAWINAVNKEGMTALHCAVESSNQNIIEQLIKAYALPYMQDNFGNSPVHLAVLYGDKSIVEKFIKLSIVLNVTTSYGADPLFLAVQEGHVDIVELLLEKGMDIEAAHKKNGYTALQRAAELGNKTIVNLLIKAGVNVNAENKEDEGYTALHLAAFSGHSEIVEILLEAGASIDARTDGNSTPILFAAGNGHLITVKKLIEKGADIKVKNHSGQTLFSKSLRGNNLELVKFLYEEDINIDSINSFKETLLIQAIKGNNPEIVNFILEKGANIELGDYSNKTPLHYAVEENNFDIVKVLIEKDVNIHAQNTDNKTALHYAVANNNIKMVEFLLDKNADIEAADKFDYTVLNHAVQSYISLAKGIKLNVDNLVNNNKKLTLEKKFEVIKYLVEKGANIESKGADGQMIYTLVIMSSNLELFNCFFEGASSQNVINNIVKKVVLVNNLELLEACLSFKDKSGEFKFKVNDIINEDGQRLIDLASVNLNEVSRTTIKCLREHGSVEPKKPIQLELVQKLILIDNQAPDSIFDNWGKAENILKIMSEKYPLTDDQVELLITEFKEKISNNIEKDKKSLEEKIINKINSGCSWEEIITFDIEQQKFIEEGQLAAWGTKNHPMTVIDVINELAARIEVLDRLKEPWNFKQVLGTIIYITQGNEDKTNELIYTLSQIKMCNLSKLIYLLFVVQDEILEDEGGAVDYSKVDFSEYMVILKDATDYIHESCKEKTPLAMIKWYYDNVNVQEVSDPMQWCSHTQVVQGALNQAFMNNDNVNCESYHFNDGLKTSLINPLLDMISLHTEGSHLEMVSTWQQFMKAGSAQFAEEYFKKIIDGSVKLEELEEAEGLFEMSFGYLQALPSEVIKIYYSKIVEVYGQNEGITFLSSLLECDLNPAAIGFIESALHPELAINPSEMDVVITFAEMELQGNIFESSVDTPLF